MSAPSAGAVDEGEPKHVCPICYENEDDHGICGQCFQCGQLFCGDCNVPEKMGRVADCPMCRGTLRGVPAEVQVERLVALLARSPGRHTPVAQLNLGTMYELGTGVAQDPTEAARLYRLAADQGHVIAQYKLAWSSGRRLVLSNSK